MVIAIGLVTLGSITLTLIVGVQANGEIVVRNEGYLEYCDAEEFQAHCKENEVIFMQNALYGRMRTGRCVDTNYGYVGCGKDVLHLADWMCSGRPTCRIPVPNSAFKKETDCPIDLKPYFEASYTCLEVQTAPEQSCHSSTFVLPSSTSGYLSNHVTMETRKGSEDCPWMIQGRSGQRINFTIFDFARKDLRVSSPLGVQGICRVYAVVRETGRSRGDTICSGNSRIVHAYTSTTHAVEVRILGKKDAENPEYFLLKYEIIGCADPDLPEDAILRRNGDVAMIHCSSTNQKWKLICEGNTWSGRYGNCSRASRQATFGEIVWGNLFMSFEMSLTIVVGIAVGIGIVILVCGVICIRSACGPPKKTRTARKRAANSVLAQRPPAKRTNANMAPLPPPPHSPGGALRPEMTHGPLPPPPAFLVEKDVLITENEYSSISEMPPPPLSPPPPPLSPSHSPPPTQQGTVIVNKMAASRLDTSDSDPDYTSPPTPYSSPQHINYDIESLRSSEDNLASDCEIPVQYFYKNKYSVAGDTAPNSKFSMKIYSKSPSSELPPYYERGDDHNDDDRKEGARQMSGSRDAAQASEAFRPYECQTGQSPKRFAGSLQSRYWRNKYTGALIPNLHASDTSLCSRSGGSTV